jgi:hypothetical protein
MNAATYALEAVQLGCANEIRIAILSLCIIDFCQPLDQVFGNVTPLVIERYRNTFSHHHIFGVGCPIGVAQCRHQVEQLIIFKTLIVPSGDMEEVDDVLIARFVVDILYNEIMRAIETAKLGLGLGLGYR